ncbi:MAG: MBL fold metallo-hydrolase [Clostridia bacterium]|nr:MBL fold metallo-hydrolase [Clostridia bacterium]
MKIRYFGHSHFLFVGNDYSITLDPFKRIGLKEFKTESDYLFCSHEHYDHNNRDLAFGAREVKNGYPFEIIQTFHDEKNGALRGKNSVLVFEMDGVRVAFLGDLGEYSNERLIEKLKGVDLLLIPVGGTYTVDYNGAFEYVEKIKPKAVIPMHYHLPNGTVDIDGVDKFLNKFKSYKAVNSPFTYSGEGGIIHLISEQGE